MSAWKEDIDSQLILTVGAVSGNLFFVLAIGMQAWFMYEEQGEINAKYSAATHNPMADLKNEQTERIHNYRWANQNKTVAAIPIDQAMQLLIQNNGKLPSTQPTTKQAK